MISFDAASNRLSLAKPTMNWQPMGKPDSLELNKGRLMTGLPAKLQAELKAALPVAANVLGAGLAALGVAMTSTSWKARAKFERSPVSS